MMIANRRRSKRHSSNRYELEDANRSLVRARAFGFNRLHCLERGRQYPTERSPARATGRSASPYSR